MPTNPIKLQDVLDSVDELWSPQIVAQFNNYDVRVAKFLGEYIWHTHDNTDETFLVLDGELIIELQEAGEHRRVTLPKGSMFVVPRGVPHKPVAPGGASIMMIEPTGTVNVGDSHEEIPAHIEVTTGHHG